MSFSSSLVFVPQKARFKAVESLREPKSRAIVVATDVAARGLDIPSVATVVHYDVARQVDTFIHRAGRTAVSLMCGCFRVCKL
jgi:ATP-dependent RNA helicase DDX24/MAK5